MSTDPRTVKAYDENAKAYQEHILDPASSPLHEYYEKPAIRAELPDLNRKTVLSLGCGSGEDADWLRAHGALSVTGVDISSGLISLARKSYPQVAFEVMDMAELNFPDNSFDLIYSSLALHYVADWTSLLKKAYKTLKLDGQIVFSCNHPLETAMQPFANSETRGFHIGRSIDQITEKRSIYGDYMVAASAGVVQRESTVANSTPVYSYHRTFGNMVTSIIDSGFVIAKLVEPLPLVEMQKQNPEHYKQVLKTPKFMVWHLRKGL